MFDPKPLGDAVFSHTGGGTPPRQVPSYWGGDIPWASVKDFSEDSEQISSTQETITRKGLNASASNLIPAGTPLVCTRMAVGRAAMSSVPLAINQDVKALYPAPGFTPPYLLAVMLYAQRFAEAQSIGSTVKGIRIEDYLAIPVPQAPKAEQPKIAEVLASLNKTIHHTEAVVEKLKQLKQGLLHDLLTRGVDSNGELRPCYEQAPELYQESPLGWVPKDWDVIPLLDAAVNITDGTHQAVTTVSSDQGDVPFLFVSCVRDGEVDWDKAACITRRDYQTISKGREPVAGIVLYTAVGSYGHAAEVRELREFSFQRHIACIYPKKGKVAQGFMPLFLNWEMVRRYADRVALGNAQKTVTLGELSAYPFVCPHPTEQFEIVSRMSVVQQKLCDEMLILKKLKLEKLGLLDDLLTGCVRVTPLLAQ